MNPLRLERSIEKEARLAVVKEAVRKAVADTRSMLAQRIADILRRSATGAELAEMIPVVLEVYGDGMRLQSSDVSQDLLLALFPGAKAQQPSVISERKPAPARPVAA